MTLAGRAYCKQLPVCLLLACVASLFLICLVTLAPSFLALDFLGPLYMGAVPLVVSMWSLQGPSPCLGGRRCCRASRAAVHPHSHFSLVLPLSLLRTRAGRRGPLPGSRSVHCPFSGPGGGAGTGLPTGRLCQPFHVELGSGPVWVP